MQTQVGHKAQKQARKPGAVVVAQGAGAFAALASTATKPATAPAKGKGKGKAAAYTALPQASAPSSGPALALPAPATPATLPPVTVALRGGLAIAAVCATGKVYRVTAPHNVAWWDQVKAAMLAGGGTAQVQALVAAGVPAIMVGYLVRRGYLKAA